MAGAYYICPSIYSCACPSGRLVSRRTTTRHRDIAQARLRVLERDPTITLPLPPPFFPELGVTSHELDAQGSEELVSNTESLSDYMSVSEQASRIAIDQVFNADSLSTTSDSLQSPSQPLSSASSFPFISPSEASNGSFDIPPPQSPGLFPELDPDYETKRFLDMYGWHCGFYLRHNLTLGSMNDILFRDFPQGIKTWNTVRSRMESLSGLRKRTYYHCDKSHVLLSIDENTGRVESCNHQPCDARETSIQQLSYIGVWERIHAILLNENDGPTMLNYVRDGYLRHRADGVMVDFFLWCSLQRICREARDLQSQRHCTRLRHCACLSIHVY